MILGKCWTTLCQMSSVKCQLSTAYVDPWDMLNNFCFHVYAQKWHTLKYRIKGAPFIRGKFFLPTSDGNISETVHSIYLKFGVLRVAIVNS